MRTVDKPFSEIAPDYDATFSDLPHVRSLRARTHALMLQHFPRNGRILELGCGTGIDAAFLAVQGYDVLASDPSTGMLREARRRLQGFAQRPNFLCMPVQHLACLRDQSFDGILSNFGVLNCIDNLAPVLEDAYHVLRDNGTMILTLMNRFSLTETVAYLQHGQMRKAFRRWRRGGVLVSVGKGSVLTWYHSLRSIKKMIRGKFTVQTVTGLNILTPPPAFERIYASHPKLVALADALDRRIESIPVISVLGDHFVIVLERFE